MVGNQIGNLTPGASFDHNLCLKYPNGLCEPILDIYISKAFQWYKELFNPMGFDPYNFSLKIQEFIGTPTPKVRAHLGVRSSFPHTLHTSWASLLARTLASPCLGCEPKARVVTMKICKTLIIGSSKIFFVQHLLMENLYLWIYYKKIKTK
jgi:hypothetical protein